MLGCRRKVRDGEWMGEHNNQSEDDRDVRGSYWEGSLLLAAATEVEAEETDTVAVARPKQVTDGRTVDGGSRVPAGPKEIGGGKK